MDKRETISETASSTPTPRLGEYELLRELSRGGMGIVYVAQKRGGQRQVVLKTIRPDRAGLEEMRRRFEREVSVLEKFNHDHIMPIYDFGHEGEVMYMVMPLLPGMTLEHYLDAQPNLPADEVVRIGIECLKGLSAAHAADVIHRDIKPSNIYLETLADRPSQPRVRLIDFGLAKPLEEKQGVTRLAGGCGTPGYMAPEQLQGRSVSPKTDLFALGCVLYRMATGTLPFARHKGETDSSFEAFANQLSDPAIQPVPPGERNPQLPSELGDLMLRLLAKDPARRPADADQVMRDLLAIQGKPPGLTETKTFVDTTPEPPSDAPMPAPETPAKRRSIGCSISITITACVALIVASLGIVTLITAPGARAEREKYEVVQKELEILRAERDKLVREEKERLEAEAKNIKTKRELDLKFAAELESFKRRLGEIRGGSGSSENRALKERELEEEQLRWEQAKLKQEKHLQAVLAQLKQNAEEQRRALEANHNRVQTVVVPAPSYYRYHPYYGWGGW